MSHNNQKKVAVVNDFSGFGRCSIAVSLPIISAMKIQCCPLPTAIFSNHTGFPSFFWTDYTEHMEEYAAEWEKLGLVFDAIATGFLGSEHQLEIVQRFLSRFKTEKTTVLVDPVMGDYGRLYPTYSQSLAEGMRALVRFADILTPNLTEACVLAGIPYREDMTEMQLYDLCTALAALGPDRIVISGLERGDSLGNFVYQAGKAPVMLLEKRAGPNRSGTGDVFSSIIAADTVNGVPFRDSVEHASSFVARAIRRSEEMGIPRTDGICFEELLTEL